MKLVDMAYSKAELKKQDGPVAAADRDPYPWGLCLHLEKEQLDKLGVKELPEVGSEFHFVAVAKVTSVNHSARQGQDENCSVGLQITMMQIALQESAAEEKSEGKETPAKEARETPSIMKGGY